MDAHIRKKKSMNYSGFTSIQVGLGILNKSILSDEVYTKVYNNVSQVVRNDINILKEEVKKDREKDLNKIRNELIGKIEKLKEELDIMRKELRDLSDSDSDIPIFGEDSWDRINSIILKK